MSLRGLSTSSLAQVIFCPANRVARCKCLPTSEPILFRPSVFSRSPDILKKNKAEHCQFTERSSVKGKTVQNRLWSMPNVLQLLQEGLVTKSHLQYFIYFVSHSSSQTLSTGTGIQTNHKLEDAQLHRLSEVIVKGS